MKIEDIKADELSIENWLDNSELGVTLWRDKYQQNDESFTDWIDRVSGGDASIRQLILDKKFLFGGRILANRGITDRKVTYSNCYCLPPVDDSIEDIYDTAKHLARTFSYGGGVGFDISKLRPKGAPVNNSAKTTTGAVSFMETFAQVGATIGQEGRRGALMLSMDCNHADIEDFIDAKKNTDKLESCNISVRVDDEFMSKVTDPKEKESYLYNKLCVNNWDYAEPGILYWDTINKYNMLSEYIKNGDFEYAGVNPCGELSLPAGGSCLLGSLNLSEFVLNAHTQEAVFDLPQFRYAVERAVIALNDVLEEGLPLHPLKMQRDAVEEWRQIGLGIMGFGDMLIKLGITYGVNERCLKLIDLIGNAMVKTGLKTSCELAKERGAFKNCDNERIVNSSFIKAHRDTGVITEKLINDIRAYGIRNSNLFTIPPTGSIGTMLGISTGVEPIFNYSYTRTTKSLNEGVDTKYTVITQVILDNLRALGIDHTNIDNIELPSHIIWAGILNPFHRVQVQAQWQKHIDASISSTVNITNDTNVDVVKMLYYGAWELGCKGLTIYRDGCSREGILKTDDTPKKQPEPVEIPNSYSNDVELDTDIENCIGRGTRLQTGCGTLWLTAYFHKETGQLNHIFLDKGSKGGCNSFMVALSRMISDCGKRGASIDEIVDQLESTHACNSYSIRNATKKDTSKGTSCPSAIGYALKRLHANHMQDIANMKTVEHEEEVERTNSTNKTSCPSCGMEMSNTGGCVICLGCGFSKCD